MIFVLPSKNIYLLSVISTTWCWRQTLTPTGNCKQTGANCMWVYSLLTRFRKCGNDMRSLLRSQDSSKHLPCLRSSDRILSDFRQMHSFTKINKIWFQTNVTNLFTYLGIKRPVFLPKCIFPILFIFYNFFISMVHVGTNH